VPLAMPGKRPGAVPLINAHSAEVQDLDWSPFDDSLLATASDDATLRLWSIPDSMQVFFSCLLRHYVTGLMIIPFGRSRSSR
jgi:coronin-1B/1C/6